MTSSETMGHEERIGKRGSQRAGRATPRCGAGVRFLLPWLVLLLLLLPQAGRAAVSLVNGDFSNGLAGWEIATPGLFVDNGAAVMVEGLSNPVSLGQTFTIQGGTPTLHFTLQSLKLANNQIPDAFQVSLTDTTPQAASLLGVIPGGGYPGLLLSFQQNGEIHYAPQVTIAGAPASGGIWTSRPETIAVSVDISAVAVDTSARLVFDLINFGPLRDGGVRIDNVQTVAFPVAINDTAATDEDTPVNIPVLHNDSDPDGTPDPATVTVATKPLYGTAAALPDGRIRYTPAFNSCGGDSFTYTVRDDHGNLSNAATVHVTVACVNDPPVADAGRDQSVTAGDTVALDGSGSADPEDGAVATYLWEQVGTPAVTLSSAQAAKPTFTAPDAGPLGLQLTFRLTVTDSGQLASSDTVTISVAQAGFRPPTAEDDSATTAEDTPVTIPLLQNDTAATGASLNPATVVLVAAPERGAVSINLQNGDATYTQAADYHGSDRFSYKVRDSRGLISNEALVLLTVTAVNDPPVANAGPDQSVVEGSVVTLSGAASGDTEGGAVSYLWEQIGGTAVILSTPNAVQTTFTAPGTVGVQGVTLTFRLTVTDQDPGQPLQSTDSVVVQVVQQAFVPPVAVADGATTEEDTPVVIALLQNDTNSAGGFDAATVKVVTAPSHGVVTLDAQTGAATYTPAANYFGSDSFGYQVRDKNGVLSNVATVTLTVTALNDPPVADAGPDQTVREEFLVTLDGSASKDVEDASLAFAWAQIGGTPTVTLSGAGAAKPTFTAPNVGPEGALLTFRLTVTDSAGLQGTATVAIRIVDAVIACDVNDDRVVNVVDAVLLLRVMTGLPNGSAAIRTAADVNRDQRLGMPEVLCALQTAAGLAFDPNRDADGDGFTPAQGDCNDADPAIHPGAAEICNGIDDNCNGQIDEGLPQVTYCRDADGDGYGDPNATLRSCRQPAGYVVDSTDCNDGDRNERPGQVWYKDADGDGHSDGTTLTACARPAGYKLASELTATSGDCDDTNAALHAGQTWYRDADGDGHSDGTTLTACVRPTGYKLASELTATSGDCDDANAALQAGQTWYRDADGDGHSDGTTQTACARPAGYRLAAELTATSGDCDDTNAALRPGQTWYRDADGDGHSDGTTQSSCVRPAGYKLATELTATSGDCDDTNAAFRPGQTWYRDMDGDGHSDGTTQSSCARPAGYKLATELTATSGDCDDTNATLRVTLTGYADQDGDGYTRGGAQSFCTNGTLPAGYVAVPNGEDCDDTNGALRPGQTWYRDMDGDGHSDGTTQISCARPAGYKLASELTATSGDCDDTNAALRPGQTWYRDMDGDGHSDGTTQISCARPAGYKLATELTATSGDCDDTNAALRPGQTWYRDMDGDGHSDGTTQSSCARPAGYKLASELTATSGDCDDTDAALRPGQTWYRDADGDGHSDGTTQSSCVRPAGYKLATELTATSGDCDDTNATLRVALTGYADQDGDGYTKGGALSFCTNGTLPTGYVAAPNGEDCDDANAALRPGQTWYRDMDGDGHSDGTTQSSCSRPAGYKLATELTATSGDCDDTNAALRVTLTGYADQDGDGYTKGGAQSLCTGGTLPTGYVAAPNGEDCDDANAAVRPGATEVCNGIDDNCNGQVDEGLTCPSCTYSGFSPDGGSLAFYDAARETRVYQATTTTGTPFNGLKIAVHGQRGAAGVYPGAYAIPEGTSPATSHTVVIVDSACGAQPGSCTKSFLAVGGTLTVTAYGVVGERFAGSLANVVLKEAVIAPDGSATLVPDGETWCIDHYGFDTTLAAPEPPGPPVVPDNVLVSYGWQEGGFEGFKFSTAAVVQNAQDEQDAVDFYVEHNLVFLGRDVGILSLGNGVTLADIASVPSTGYVGDGWSVPPFHLGEFDATGYVYALKLADGSYAAIQFTRYAHDPEGDDMGPRYTTFSYKYPLTAVPPPPGNVVSGTHTLLSRNDGADNDAFVFGAQQTVPGGGSVPWVSDADIMVSGSSLYLSETALLGGLQELADGTTLAATTEVPAYNYMPSWHLSFGYLISTGRVYALRLADGRYAAVEFTEINAPTGTAGTTRHTFHYRYQTNGTPSLQ